MNKYTMQITRNEATVKLAELDGRTLEPHEGFNRNNDGHWLIAIKDDQGETVGTVTVFFLGKAGKRSAYCAPDPEGQAISNEIAEQFNCSKQ
jgi:hypothetical protein